MQRIQVADLEAVVRRDSHSGACRSLGAGRIEVAETVAATVVAVHQAGTNHTYFVVVVIVIVEAGSQAVAKGLVWEVLEDLEDTSMSTLATKAVAKSVVAAEDSKQEDMERQQGWRPPIEKICS